MRRAITRGYTTSPSVVLRRREHDIHREERLWQRHAPVRAVIQRALEPLHGRRPQRVLVQHHEVPRERADALRAHRVPLVCHGRGPDLSRLERLLNFLHVKYADFLFRQPPPPRLKTLANESD